MLIGAAAPWAVAIGPATNPTSDKPHVWLVVFAAVVALLALFLFRRRSTNWSLWLCGLAGLCSTGLLIHERPRLEVVSHVGGAAVQVPSQIDWGLNLATGASIILVLAIVAIAAFTSARIAAAVFVLTGNADHAAPDRIGLLRYLTDLRDRGTLNDEEFATEKTRLLSD